MIKSSDVSLELPMVSVDGHIAATDIFSDMFSTDQELPFSKLIESSRILHRVYEFTSAGADLESLEKQVPELESEVR